MYDTDSVHEASKRQLHCICVYDMYMHVLMRDEKEGIMKQVMLITSEC